jgi:CO/xanthine dehydrogenase Mo-binding subunit
LTVPGVKDVVEVSQGVAVVAEHTWAAFQGAKALAVTWDTGSFSMNSADVRARLVELAEREGAVARDDGDCDGALSAATKRVEATYDLPYLAHATMEPMNCTAHVQPDRCEVWAPTQSPQGTQSAAARITGLPIERVTTHVTYIGCGWGRRSRTDFVQDAVETSMKIGAPVQVVWTREEDMQHDLYRPTAYYRCEGGVDRNGRVSALKVRVVATPIGGRGRGRDGVDRTGVDGAANLPYGIPNVFVDNTQLHLPMPTGYWRGVGPTRNTFVIESFLDELAHAAGQDPLEVRLELLSHHPRLRHVLQVAAEQAAWGSAPPEGRARGIGLVENKGGLAAQVAEVSLDDGRVRVHRVTCAYDAGQIINPNIAEAQVVGSIVAGMTAAFYGEITLDGGRVAQSNFHDYRMLRMHEMPEVDVHIVQNHEEPGGVGEPAVPPIAPAIANALFVLTGKRIRELPIRLDTL